MGVLGSSYGNMPGMDTAYSTYEQSFGWGPYPRVVYLLPKTVDSTAVDARFVGTTWRLGPGLVMGQIAATGKYKQYDITATDGTEIAAGVLMESYRMQDVFSGANVDKQAGLMVGGPVRVGGLAGLDQKARFDMKCQGFVFDDDPRGPLMWRRIEIAGNQTVTIPTPAVGATYQNATEFIVTSASGAAVFALPAIAAGLKYKFYNANNQSLTVQSTTNNVIAFNNAAVTNVAVSTTNTKLGACLEFEATYMGQVNNAASYSWVLRNMSAGASTLTLS